VQLWCCGSCSHTVKEELQFCKNCGNDLADKEEQQEEEEEKEHASALPEEPECQPCLVHHGLPMGTDA